MQGTWGTRIIIVVVTVTSSLAVARPASATDYLVDASATNDVTFAGSACGSQSSGAVQIPVGAINIAATSPSGGDPLADGIYDEGTVAHIVSTTVQPSSDGSSQVVWTAQGSDAACTAGTLASQFGWTSEVTTLTATYQVDAGSHVYWRSARNGGDSRRPRWHSVLADVRFEKMTWRHWDSPVALGRGYVGHDDFAPNGRGGYRMYDQRALANFRLSDVTYCDDGALIYARLSVHTLQRSSGLSTWTVFNYDCNGQVDGADIA